MTVTAFDVSQRQPFADGRQFAEGGSFTRIDGTLHFAFDPDHPANVAVIDLSLAPRDANGRVHASADVTVVVPDKPARGNDTLLFDVPNRGRSITGRSLNNGAVEAVQDAFTPGDGLTFRRGFSLASVAWQSDVDPIPGAPAIDLPSTTGGATPVSGVTQLELPPLVASAQTPLTLLRNVPYQPVDPMEPDARLIARVFENGPDELIPRTKWRFATSNEGARVLELDRGVEPGRVYLLTYTVQQPKVAGAGLFALCDAASFLRGGADGALEAGSERVLGFGVHRPGGCCVRYCATA